MNKTYFYKAFGLSIESCFPIAQLPVIDPCAPDVRIVWADFTDLPEDAREAVAQADRMQVRFMAVEIFNSLREFFDA